MRVAVVQYVVVLTLFFCVFQTAKIWTANNGSSRLLTVMIDVLQTYSGKKAKKGKSHK